MVSLQSQRCSKNYLVIAASPRFPFNFPCVQSQFSVAFALFHVLARGFVQGVPSMLHA